MEDTIAAISTPIGEGGIAIIRISGAAALAIADRLFQARAGAPSALPSHTIHLGNIRADGELVDQVMLTVMRAPRSYTAEDVVEIHCHGGVLTARKVLALCLRHGARNAQPGEFTKRAFLNGRIDLTRAEAVMDLIQARSDRAHQAAAHALEGSLATRIDTLRERLITILAHLEAHLDFPEEDITPGTTAQLRADTHLVVNTVNDLLATAHEGRILRHGITVTIVGRPNVGKSSLMNALLGQDRSIVTAVPGTTRDTIEEFANIRGIPVRLTDTAGIRKTRGVVEEHGVRRSRKTLAHSDIALHVVDASRPFSRAEWDVAKLYQGRPSVVVHNKLDRAHVIKMPVDFPADHTVKVSALTGAGIDDLRGEIEKIVWSGRLGETGLHIAVNDRQADALLRAKDHLTNGLAEFERSAGLEIIAQQLRAGLDAIGEITGKTATDDILDKIFSTFCIGK